jgi:hypothetical protein
MSDHDLDVVFMAFVFGGLMFGAFSYHWGYVAGCKFVGEKFYKQISEGSEPKLPASPEKGSELK